MRENLHIAALERESNGRNHFGQSNKNVEEIERCKH